MSSARTREAFLAASRRVLQGYVFIFLFFGFVFLVLILVSGLGCRGDLKVRGSRFRRMF